MEDYFSLERVANILLSFISDEILEKLFQSQSYNDGALIVNAYLVYMGLLKVRQWSKKGSFK